MLFGGDQLTSARARGAIRARVNSLSSIAHLDGLIPCAEDWHVKLNLLAIIIHECLENKQLIQHLCRLFGSTTIHLVQQEIRVQCTSFET